MTAEQLEAARAERMRQNGHGAITIEDVRTWIEETGLCIFLPRSAQAGFTAPTFVEAVAGERTTEPTLELIASAESLLVRLEAEGVAVRLNLAGQPGDQPDYVVAGWVLPYIYALRGDRDWRRSPQLTGSRQVSPLAVQAAKQLETANLTAAQIRDALGRETTETAVLRALHELWKQLRVIPVVPEVGAPALWQPLRQRFQKAIAEGASTSQVTAISVLASIYLQAVIAASMEDVEMFLSPLTSRSKIREVVRGLAATRQVHSTTMGHSPMFYVAGTLPEFPALPSYQAGMSQSTYRSSSYRSSAHLSEYLDQPLPEEEVEPIIEIAASSASLAADAAPAAIPTAYQGAESPLLRRKPVSSGLTGGKSAPPQRPRAGRSGGAVHPRERSRTASGSGETRANGDRRRVPAPRSSASNGNGVRHAASPAGGHSHNGHSGNGHSGNGHNHANGNGHRPANGAHGTPVAKSASPAAKNGSGTHKHHAAAAKPSRPAWVARANGNGSANGAKSGAGARPGARPAAHADARAGSSRPKAGTARAGTASSRPASANGAKHTAGHGSAAHGAANAAKNGSARNGGSAARPVSKSSARPASRSRTAAGNAAKRSPVAVSASKRLSFSGQAKQAPKATAKHGATAKPAAKAVSAGGSRSAASKRRG